MRIFPITPRRYVWYATILAQSLNQRFTPFTPLRKETNSCVIGNGIPKSGTYLINSILDYLGKWENIGVHIHPGRWDNKSSSGDPLGHRCLAQFSVQKLRNGQMVAAHLEWSKGLEKSIAHVTGIRRVKHVLIYRDPRDTMVSYMNFVAYPERYAGDRQLTPEAQRLREQSDDDQRLTCVIQSRLGYYLASSRRYNRYLDYAPWLNSPNCFAVKFEELYPEVVDLKNKVLGNTLRNLINYLEIDDVSIDLVDFYDKVYGKSSTASSEEDKVGQYKRVFNSQHYDLLDNPDFRNLLHTFGYEW